jgi:hypothetical protein
MQWVTWIPDAVEIARIAVVHVAGLLGQLA